MEKHQQLSKNYYSGRSTSKKSEDNFDLTKPPCKGLAIIYQRLSTHEQVQDHVFSIKMQDALVEMAKRDGYPAQLIHAEKRDLGLSGTLGSDERPGLAYLIRIIEEGKAESIYVVHASRLYRDQSLIDGFAFGELCKKHGVVIVTPTMRLNLRNDMHMRIYRMELDWSAQELKMIKERMHGARDFKGRQGFYAGGQLAAGFILDTREGSPTFEKFIPYEPHAKVVRYIFEKTCEHRGRRREVIRAVQQDDIYFPFFPAELAPIMNHRTSLKFTRKHSQGWIITESLIRSITVNPVYIGWWLWKGEIVSKQNHVPLIDAETFWTVQEIINSRSSNKVWSRANPLPLSGLLICGNHAESSQNNRPIRIHSSRSHPRYECWHDYRIGTTDRICLTVKNYILDVPICTFIVTQCSYANYLDKVLEHLADAHRQSKERTEARKRELERVEAEIENLKSHLAITKSQEQASIILEEMEKRLAQKRELITQSTAMADELSALGRSGSPTLTPTDIDKVKEFLSNMGEHWDTITDELKNRFLATLLQRVIIHHHDRDITAEIMWKTGLVQKLWIRRPYGLSDAHQVWSEREKNIIRQHYADASIAELKQMLPLRSWDAIKNRAGELRLKRKKIDRTPETKPRGWTEQEDEIVRQYYAGDITIHEACEVLGRSKPAIHFRGLRNLRLKKARNAYRFKKAVEWGILDDGFGGKLIPQVAEPLVQKNGLNTLSKFCWKGV